jgi:hypothetical protein
MTITTLPREKCITPREGLGNAVTELRLSTSDAKYMQQIIDHPVGESEKICMSLEMNVSRMNESVAYIRSAHESAVEKALTRRRLDANSYSREKETLLKFLTIVTRKAEHLLLAYVSYQALNWVTHGNAPTEYSKYLALIGLLSAMTGVWANAEILLDVT